MTSQATSPAIAPAIAPGPSLLEGLSLLSEVVDQLVVGTVRDTHLAWSGRVHGVLRRPTAGLAELPRLIHHGIAGAVYGGIGAGLRAASTGLELVARSGRGPRLEASAPGRHLASTLNGLIGDRLARERPGLALPLTLRHDGASVPPDVEGLATAYPSAAPRVVVFVPGLCEDERAWERQADRVGSSYPRALADVGWTPLLVRANTGLTVDANGALLADLLTHVVAAWPVPVERVVIVGHSMGGLVARAAVARDAVWTPLVTDVVTLGTPHLGAPLAGWARDGALGLARLPETAAFGRILDQRSVGILDLERGLDTDAAPLPPHVRIRLVSGSMRRRAAVRMLGDGMVRRESASGGGLFPGADTLHLTDADHFDLLNDDVVRRALLEWLD
jgi:pimeloyl-ACP methyl ester carboxylesterase